MYYKKDFGGCKHLAKILNQEFPVTKKIDNSSTKNSKQNSCNILIRPYLYFQMIFQEQCTQTHKIL